MIQTTPATSIYICNIFRILVNHRRGPLRETFLSQTSYVFIHHNSVVTFEAQVAAKWRSQFYDSSFSSIAQINRRCGQTSLRFLCCRIWRVDVRTFRGSRAERYSSHAAAKFQPSSLERLLLALVRDGNPRLWYRWYLFPPCGDHRLVVNSSWHPAPPPAKVCMAERQWRHGNNKTPCTNKFFVWYFFPGFHITSFFLYHEKWSEINREDACESSVKNTYRFLYFIYCRLLSFDDKFEPFTEKEQSLSFWKCLEHYEDWYCW